MKEYITLEEFVHEHPNEVIEIRSPGSYVTIHPDMRLTGLVGWERFLKRNMRELWNKRY